MLATQRSGMRTHTVGMTTSKPKRPRAPNELARLINVIATGKWAMPRQNPVAVALGRKGGVACAKKLTAKQWTEIAKRAAKAL